jgi:cyclopropane fatty-acyl-phospholipid synthase-like methyltransferase
MNKYDKNYYKERHHWTQNSVLAITSLIFQKYKPNSVLDLGCANGSWLSTILKEYQIDDICGVDGHCIEIDSLLIPKSKFKRHNLEKVYLPNRKFDLVVSMEVAEHLDSKFADNFVTSLTNAGDLIVFSAAIPLQGGTNHYNEQQQSYWKKKFQQKGFASIDYIRPKIWELDNVRTDYKQNTFLYINETKLEDFNSPLSKFKINQNQNITDIVHPELFQRRLKVESDLNVIGLKKVLRALPRLILNALSKKIY